MMITPENENSTLKGQLKNILNTNIDTSQLVSENLSI